MFTTPFHTVLFDLSDLGYEETCVIPVYHGYPILHAYQISLIAGRAIDQEIRRLLTEYYTEKDPGLVPSVEQLSDEFIENIKGKIIYYLTAFTFIYSKGRMLKPKNVRRKE